MEQVVTVHNGAKKLRKPNMSHQSKERRRRVITRLENQLKSGVKLAKLSTAALNGEPGEPLTEGDISRIKKEILVLNSRI